MRRAESAQLKLTFYVMLEALERWGLELIRRPDDWKYLKRNLDQNRFQQIESQYRRAGQAARSLFSYLNISDILRLAAMGGRISVQDSIVRDIKEVLDGAAHVAENLVSSYEDVRKLANVKRECLRLLAAAS